MNNLSLKNFSFVLIILLFFTVSCIKNIKENKITTGNAKYNFMFASDSSEFKDSIREKLIAKYSGEASINLVNIDKIKDIKAKDYDVILIMDTCVAGARGNTSMDSFLTNLKDNKNVVLFITYGGSDCTYSNKGIDAITSASKIDDSEINYQKISKQIDKIITDKK
jgi:hypothetical protein